MIKFFKELKQNILTLLQRSGFMSDQLADIYDLLKNKTEAIPTAPLLVVARHTLGSIDVSDIEDPDKQSDEDYLSYCARAAQFYDLLEKEAKYMVKLQHDYWFTQAEGESQMMFGRGTSNGIQLMLDRFEKLKNIYIDKTKIEEKPEIGSREDILASLQVRSNESEDAEVNE